MSKNQKSPALEATEEEVKGAQPTVLERHKQLKVKYYDRFQKSEAGLSDKRKMWSILDMFDRGEQWKDVAMPPWVSKPITNLIRYLRTVKRANLASALPKCRFISLEKEDEELIKKLDNAYNHVWEWEHVPRILRRCVDRSLLHGTSIAYVYEDLNYVKGKYYNKQNPKNRLYQGKICVKQWPVTNFFPDPDAYRIEECKYITTTEAAVPFSSIKNNPAYVNYMNKTYGEKIAAQLWETMKGDTVDAEDSSMGTIYNRDNTPGISGSQIKGDEMLTIYCHYEQYMVATGNWQLDISYYTRNNDFFLYRKEKAKPNRYPFAVYYDEEEDQDFWGTSMAMDVLENQKVVNKTSQTAAIIATMHQNPQKIVSRESGINGQEMARTGTMPGKVWTSNGDPSQAVHMVQNPDIPRGLFDMEDRLKNDIKEMNGITESYTGQNVGSLTTSTGVNSLIERATVRDKDKMLQIDAFVEDISDLIIQFIGYKWKEERPLSIPQRDGTTKHDIYEPITEGDFENLQWLLRCDTYASAPMTQALRKQQADNWMQMQGQFNFQPAVIIPQEWIAAQEHPDEAKILTRMQKDAEIIAKQQQTQTPKINPDGDIQISLTTKDQTIIAATLGDMQKQAMHQQQETTALMMEHMNNGVNVAPGTGAAPAAQQGGAPAGTMGNQALQNMIRGN
jgi:hypothetical protein